MLRIYLGINNVCMIILLNEKIRFSASYSPFPESKKKVCAYTMTNVCEKK